MQIRQESHIISSGNHSVTLRIDCDSYEESKDIGDFMSNNTELLKQEYKQWKIKQELKR